jgi:hypothetical protein
MKIALLLFILPFVFVLLKLTLFSPSIDARMKKFLGDSSGILICFGEKGCPQVDRLRHRKIVVDGSLQEKQAQFLAVILQLPTTSKIIVACPEEYKEAVQVTLDVVGLKNSLLL